LSASLIRELVMGEQFLESVEVEAVFDVIDIDFAEEVVVFQIAEPGYPAAFRVV
jgi:hypothetical protein